MPVWLSSKVSELPSWAYKFDTVELWSVFNTQSGAHISVTKINGKWMVIDDQDVILSGDAAETFAKEVIN